VIDDEGLFAFRRPQIGALLTGWHDQGVRTVIFVRDCSKQMLDAVEPSPSFVVAIDTHHGEALVSPTYLLLS